MDLKSQLANIPGLPPFAANAIEREIKARIRQWQALTKAAIMSSPDLPDIFTMADDGFDHIMLLISRFGGCTVYVPHQAPDNHPLISALGEPATKWLCQNIGGSQIRVPKLDSVLVAVRDRAIRADHAAGMSVREISERYFLIQRSVQRILSCDR